jgi:hypothetical protein
VLKTAQNYSITEVLPRANLCFQQNAVFVRGTLSAKKRFQKLDQKL